MKNGFRRNIFATIFTAILILNSCKKESTGVAGYAPPPPPAPGVASVNNFALNGGSITGRWCINFIQTIDWRNDTLITLDTTSYPLGDGLITFRSDHIFTIYYQAALTDSGTYVVAGNNLTLNASGGPINMRFGIAADGSKMRLCYIDQFTSGNNIMRHEEDDMCVPY